MTGGAFEGIVGGTRSRGGASGSWSRSPALSIILPVRNAANTLEAVVLSLQRQTFEHWELIVIDGGSSDGSVDLLRGLDEHIDYWASAKDRGIYDAMNHGIEVSRGGWLYFLGVDDAFFDDRTLADVMGQAAVAGDADLIVGNVLLGQRGRLFRSRFDNRLYLRNTVHHQSAFYRRRVFDRFRYGRWAGGRIRPYQISGDYHLNLALFATRAHACYMDRIIARCADGISQQGRLTGYLEEIAIRHRHMRLPAAALCDFQTAARFFLKQFTRHFR